jgi:hypothetical protein
MTAGAQEAVRANSGTEQGQALENPCVATAANSADAVLLLLQRGANPNVRLATQSLRDFLNAMWSRHPEILSFLK